jgi:TP901 family phage tail tape measure protein
MASNANINVKIGFTTDTSGLKTAQTALEKIIVSAKANAATPGQQLNVGLQAAAKTASSLQEILQKSYNVDLGTLNVNKFNQELIKSELDIKQIKSSLEQAGVNGATAFNAIGSSILNTNIQIKESSKLLDQMAYTMANTVRWGITSAIFQEITSSLSSSVSYAENLDSTLNDIRIVTDKSAKSMKTFAEQANSAAKTLGASTLDYTEASLIYYQQGLSDTEVAARTETTLKAANVTGQTGEEVSDELTAVWNGYKVTAEETELYVDKLAAVAATTASDLEELSTGMSKVASAASNMGVDIDQLNGMMSTIISVTREAPESVGTALKTIFARMEDLELDGEDEYGVSLGDVSSSLDSMGVSILDAEGNMRDLGEVIEEVGNKWNSGVWSDAQKQALAIDLAGKR